MNGPAVTLYPNQNATPTRRRRRRRKPAVIDKENLVPPEALAKCAPPLRLAIERLSGAKVPPRWMNLDNQITSLDDMTTLHTACKGQPTVSLVTLSMRYCTPLPEEALDALVEFVKTNTKLETLYLHLTVTTSDKTKKELKQVWESQGRFHRVLNDGQTYFRKVDLAYLQDDRAKHVPAWANVPKKKPKKGGKKGKKKK